MVFCRPLDHELNDDSSLSSLESVSYQARYSRLPMKLKGRHLPSPVVEAAPSSHSSVQAHAVLSKIEEDVHSNISNNSNSNNNNNNPSHQGIPSSKSKPKKRGINQRLS